MPPTFAFPRSILRQIVGKALLAPLAILNKVQFLVRSLRVCHSALQKTIRLFRTFFLKTVQPHFPGRLIRADAANSKGGN